VHDLKTLAAHCVAAIATGTAAAEAQINDGGSANLDHVVLTGLERVRLASMESAGVPVTYKDHRFPGWFHLSAPFPGIGQRNYAGVQAMAKHLQDAGVPCHIHYQMD
jgi:hypothetical protein